MPLRDHVAYRFSQIVRIPAASELVFLVAQMQTAVARYRRPASRGPRKDRSLLGEVGVDKTKIVSAMIWLTDIADYDGFQTAWMAGS